MIYQFLFSVFILSLSLSLIYLCKKNNFLMHKSGDIHQEYTNKTTTPLIGGTIIFCSIFLFNLYDLNLFLVYVFCIFLIGLLSDLKKIKSPTMRLLFQLFVIVLAVYSLDIILSNTRLILLDQLLNNYYFAILFTSFCILIIVNGTNFIDGVNSLVIGYYIIISFVLLFLQQKGFTLSLYFSHYLLLCLIILYFLNLFNKLYLGDAGAYLLGFVFSLELVNFYLQNSSISPFFIILLLWYPAFENLFSILRKVNLNKSPIYPDIHHLHQLIFLYFMKKNFTSLKANNITGIAINTYIVIIVMISLLNPGYSQLHIILILVNLCVYIFFYLRLFKNK